MTLHSKRGSLLVALFKKVRGSEILNGLSYWHLYLDDHWLSLHSLTDKGRHHGSSFYLHRGSAAGSSRGLHLSTYTRGAYPCAWPTPGAVRGPCGRSFSPLPGKPWPRRRFTGGCHSRPSPSPSTISTCQVSSPQCSGAGAFESP